VTYFAAAFSAALVLNAIAFRALGIEAADELPYWVVHVAVILAIGVLAVPLALPLGPAPAAIFPRLALLTYGACLLLGSFVLAGAAVTLAVSRELGFIPNLKRDAQVYEQFEAAANLAYYECLRAESAMMNAFYSAFLGPFEELRFPIDELSFMLPVSYVGASLLFVVLCFFGASRRRWVAASTAGLSCAIIFAAMLVAAAAYGNYLYRTTPCIDRAIQSTFLRSGEQHARELASVHLQGKGVKVGASTLVDVDVDKRSVILRVQVDPELVARDAFPDWASKFRRRILDDFCDSATAKSFQTFGLSRVRVLRYGDTETTETVVENPDSCKK
jgi:hypothetical protein